MANEIKVEIVKKVEEVKKDSVLNRVNWRFVAQSAIIWAIANIIIGFLISQGSSEDSAYIGIIYLILVIAGIYIALRKNHFTLYKSALAYSITCVIIFALLDYLLVNLFLQGNMFNVYREWYIATSYAIVILVPLIPFSVKIFRLRANKKTTK